MPSLLPIVLLTAAVAGHAPVSHAGQPQGSRPRSTPAPHALRLAVPARRR